MDPAIQELHLFSDACRGQHKNNTLNRFLLALASTGHFKNIYQYFPVWGHSFFQWNRNFSSVKRKMRITHKIYNSDDYMGLIKTSRKFGYSMKNVIPQQILDFKNWWPIYFKKASKNQEKLVRLSVFKHRLIEYFSSITVFVICSEFIDWLVKSRFFPR